MTATIVTVTANAAWDRTLEVETLAPGRRHEVRRSHAQAGGKGVNVSRVLAALGLRVRTVVVVGGATGETLVGELARAGLDPRPVPAPGDSRTCLEVLEPGTGRATQLHEVGVAADAGVAAALERTVAAALDGALWLALCGSLARGLPAATYARLVALGRARGVRVALDTSGDALRAGWAAAPDVLRVNREEAAAVLVGAGEGEGLAAPSADPTQLCVVSDGAGTTRAWTRAVSWWIEPPRLAVRNAIGCGDAMLAGLLFALASGSSTEDALRSATALGSADAESVVAGRPDPVRARALEPKVRIVRRDARA